jgi:hypothetical protein
VAITVETKNPLKVAVNQQNMAIKKTPEKRIGC